MGIIGKGLTTYLNLSTKTTNNKQKSRFLITDITKQDFRKLQKNFENPPYLGYNNKQVHNEPTEAYFFLIKNITKLIKSKSRVQLHTKFVKLGVNEKIGHVKKTIGKVNKAIKYEELESINIMITCADKDKQTSSVYDIKGEENTSRTSENK